MFQSTFQLNNSALTIQEYKYKILNFPPISNLIIPKLKTAIVVNNYQIYKKKTLSNIPYLSYDDHLHSQK